MFKVIKEAIPKVMNEIYKKGGSLQFELNLISSECVN